jgi:environmental stress-induced protein Ves
VSVERFDLQAIPPQPWKNGAGLTREIAFGGASHAGFDWRLSVAEVDRDAPFSAFPGVDRRIVLLGGAGMRLRSADGRVDHALTEPLVPFSFAGEVPLQATLAGGASRDFNVMTRRDRFFSELECHRTAAERPGGDVTLLLCCAGHWAVAAGAPPLEIGPGQALLWRAPVASIDIRPSGGGATLLQVRLCHDRTP